MIENNNAGPGAGNQGGTQAQHGDAERESHEHNPDRQSDPLSPQQSDLAPDASVQSARQPTPVQQPDTRLNDSQQAGSRSAGDVQGGTSGQHASAARDGDQNNPTR